MAEATRSTIRPFVPVRRPARRFDWESALIGLAMTGTGAMMLMHAHWLFAAVKFADRLVTY